MATSLALEVHDVRKSFELGEATVDVLRGVSLELDRGHSAAVTGPSGSGKSTLLHLIGALDEPTSGTIRIEGKDPFSLAEKELARFRNKSLGFVFQEHHLLPQYSVLENVLLPTVAFPPQAAGAHAKAETLLDRVGLGHRLNHRPTELSGGERQRAAIARALVQDPAILLCDEPTGNLDHDNAQSAIDLLLELHQETRNILIIVTHNLELATRFERRFELVQGIVSSS